MREQIDRIATTLRRICVLWVVVALIACGGRSNLQNSPQDEVGSVTLASIDSVQTGATYPIFVYLPTSYESGTATYPAIYATDGDATFPPENRFVNFARILQRRHVDAILVGIGGTARRERDYLLPGAVAYHEFLTQELIPFVESHFRADPRRRTLSGISFGGSFVVTALFLEAPKTLFFSHFISAEGSFWQRSFLAQEQEFTATIGTKSIPATLILARGAPGQAQYLQFPSAGGNKSMAGASDLSRGFNPDRTNDIEVNAFYRRMRDRHYDGLTLIESDFNTDHIATDNPSFDDAMARIFK
jgi:predicted alpha/beta superfamily hydrolase